MDIFKQIVKALSRIMGSIAAAVLLFAPFTANGAWLMVAAVVVGFFCLWAYTWSSKSGLRQKENASN